MTKRILCILLLAAMLTGLFGCSSIFKKKYTSITDYTESQGTEDGSEPRLIADYDELKNAIVSAVSRHLPQDRYKFVSYNGNPGADLEKACEYVKEQTAIGSYAAEAISGDLSRIITYYEATVYIKYKKTEEDVADISYVSGKKALPDSILKMLESHETEKVFSMNSSTITSEEVVWAVFLALAMDPVSSVALPAAEVEIHPETGATRIVELRLTYGKTAKETDAMRSEISDSAEELLAAGGGDAETLCKALRDSCAVVLPGSESGENSGNAYGALVEKNADSSGFALGFKVLCDNAALDCEVVTGTVNGEFRCWNAVLTEKGFLYFDVSTPNIRALTADELAAGGYAWDAAEYSAVSGSAQ